ncbi:MAG: molybdopterin synthase sulfur carrier subunit [Nocardioides sp.]|nr:molybdopterin synthase sulfur carrier subunit [Nocardioides sp.]
MTNVLTVHFWASARAATGSDQAILDISEPLTLADLRRRLVADHPEGGRQHLEKVLSACSVLVGDRPVGSADPEEVRLVPGDTVEFLPPFAGG